MHYLFLINNDAQCFLENFFELGQLVINFTAAVLTLDKVINHAALYGARAIERVQRRKILDRVRLVAPQHIAHAVRFKLEDPRAQSFVENFFVSFYVVERDAIQIHGLAVALLDEL